MQRRAFLAATAGALLSVPRPARAAGWRAGLAAADITPEPGLWMAGYAARTEAARGTALPLSAKALALDDGSGGRAVLVTMDLLGVTGVVADRIAALVERRNGLPRAALLLNASHTHSGPVVDDQLQVAYDLDDRQRERIRAYTGRLEQRVARLVDAAIADLAPARLAFGRGEAGFAANRRVQFPDGPVDHAVPVLRVEAPEGPLRALVFGYACHNTTLQAGFVQYHGDYAGVAQREIEARHPGARALFVAGCGADANPKPRGTLALVEQHGRALAQAVERAQAGARPVEGTIATAVEVAQLPFAPAPGRDVWTAKLESEDVYVRRHARLMLGQLDRTGALQAVQPAPVQLWRLGDLTLVAISGEVVVDYALRLKREHPDERLWVAGYSNDVFGYLPSRRVLEEGGYEGGGAMLYYGKPGPFDATVEDRIFGAIDRLWSREHSQ